MSSFPQESSVRNEVPVEKKNDSVEIEETMKNHVADGPGVAVTKQRSNTTSELLGRRSFMLCEVMVPASIMLVIVGLFLIPTIYYALPESAIEFENRTTVSNRDCSQVSEYSGEVCRDELMSLQMCFSGVTSPPLNIPSSINQQTGESNFKTLVNGLSFLNPSQQCSEAIAPFLCLYIFNLCDSSNTLHTILRQDCLDIRDDVCASEWSKAVAFLGDGVLPVCEDLPDIIEDCTALSDMMNISDFGNQRPGNQKSRLVCSEGFFFDENGTELCRPTCGEFNRTPFGVQIIEKVCVCMSFITSMLLFIMALAVQRNSLLVFPSILFVYLSVTTFISSGIIIVGFLIILHCFASQGTGYYLLEEEMKPHSVPSQISMWAVLHAVFLFWAVVFPFSYRQLRISGRMHYAHIISVILAVVVPLPAALIHLKDGHVANFTPTLVCPGRNGDYTYYTFVLPVSIIVCVSSCLLVVIIWTIFKEFVLKKLLARKKVGNVGKAEIKITAIIIYYIVIGVVGLMTITYFQSYNTDAILQYIVCQSNGMASCQEELHISNDEIFAVAATVVVISFVPVVVILFSCDPQAFKARFKTMRGMLSGRSTMTLL